MFNSVSIIGNLGKEPEVKQIPNGIMVANFSIAVNEIRTRDGNKTAKTHWFNIVAYERTAEICSKHLKKGSKVAVRGQLSNRTWEANGQKRSVVEIIAREIEFLSNTNENPREPLADDNIPF